MDTRVKAVTFNSEEHKYWYKGKELKGVTRAIGKMLGKSFPDTDTVRLATLYGHDVHSESEAWIKTGKNPSTEAGKWVVKILKDFAQEHDIIKYEAELLVSDFVNTASCIDIVAHTREGCYLFDIKTTSVFDREYCSLQLSTYKKLFEDCFEEDVLGMYVIGTKSQRLFKILDKGTQKVNKILEMNKR